MDKESIKRHSFILRIWCKGDSPEWGGWIQHVNSGESIQVHTPAELLAFIDQHKNRNDPKSLEDRVKKDEAKKTGLR